MAVCEFPTINEIRRRKANSFRSLLFAKIKNKLEDLKVLRRSHDLLNNVKIGQGQLRLTI